MIHYILVKLENSNLITNILIKAIEENEYTVQHAINELDNPALSGVTCSTDYFRSLSQDCIETLTAVVTVNHTQPALVVTLSSKIAHRLSTYLLQGRATSNTSPDIMFGERKYAVFKDIQNLIHFKF